jgi:hypothetical protein
LGADAIHLGFTLAGDDGSKIDAIEVEVECWSQELHDFSVEFIERRAQYLMATDDFLERALK